MYSQENLLRQVLDKVADQISGSLRESVTEAVKRELSSSLAKAVVEGEFHKRLNDEILLGLQGIYREISQAERNGAVGSAPDAHQAAQMFTEASKQLDEVMATTLEATENIMATVEHLVERQEEAAMIIDAFKDAGRNEPEVRRLDEINKGFEESLTSIMTALSFQDLTGQRLKKVVSALNGIRETVFDLYVSTGLILKKSKEEPEKDLEQIAAESRDQARQIRNSELKGPSRASSQSDVDSLLADLGL